MIKKSVYELLEANYKDQASWAVWAQVGVTPKSNTGDMSVFESPDLLNILHDNYVLVALNASEHAERKDGYKGSWRMFHSDDDGRQQDFKMRFAFKDTPLWGSYMTDIIKDHPEKNSDQVIKHIQKNPDVLKKNVEELKKELSILGGSPTLIALGREVENWLKKELSDEFNIVYLPHYSSRVEKVKYREKVLELLQSLESQ